MSESEAREFDEDQCVICRNRQSSASNLASVVFLTHRCGHRFCKRCVDKEFSAKTKFACPAPNCKAIVERRGLTEQDLDEAEVEKDARVRKRIKAIYNKIPEDFASMNDYRDYEEEVEDIIFNLVNNIDIDATNARVESYRNEHMKMILENQSKQSMEWQILAEKIEQEERQRLSATELQREEGALERQKKQAKIDELNRIGIGDLGNEDEFGQTKPPLPSGAQGGASTNTEVKKPPAALNPVLVTLCSRPEPRPRAIINNNRSSNTGVEHRSSDQMRAMYVSGGYDYANNQKRNWQEISFAAVFQAMKLREEKLEGRQEAPISAPPTSIPPGTGEAWSWPWPMKWESRPQQQGAK